MYLKSSLVEKSAVFQGLSLILFNILTIFSATDKCFSAIFVELCSLLVNTSTGISEYKPLPLSFGTTLPLTPNRNFQASSYMDSHVRFFLFNSFPLNTQVICRIACAI